VVVLRREELPLRSDEDVVRARHATRALAMELGFSLVEQTKIVTAASELARNTVVHGGGGVLRIEALNDGPRRGLRLVFEDEGPGIPDVDLALRDGYTTGRGLGLGLGGARRLMSDLTIDVRPEQGTRVTAVRWK
jgi:serine/threonine-protein kinase RsbT